MEENVCEKTKLVEGSKWEERIIRKKIKKISRIFFKSDKNYVNEEKISCTYLFSGENKESKVEKKIEAKCENKYYSAKTRER